MSKVLSALALIFFGAACALGSVNFDCLKCHGYAGFQVEDHKLWIGEAAFEVSQHRELVCTDCHKGDVLWPHDQSLEIRCDLACHAKDKDHKKVVEAERDSTHSAAAINEGNVVSCLYCHDGAPALKGAEAQAQCLSCHPDVERARRYFPDTPGAFGAKAHRRAAQWANVPSCADCHGSHGISSGEDARASCSRGGCHEGSDASFSELFDHGSHVGEGDDEKSGTWLWLGLAVCVGLVGLLHSVKG